MFKYVKIAFTTERGVFRTFCCPRKYFTEMVITPTFLTPTCFMMAHFEAKIHKKTVESPKSNVVKGQMSTML